MQIEIVKDDGKVVAGLELVVRYDKLNNNPYIAVVGARVHLPGYRAIIEDDGSKMQVESKARSLDSPKPVDIKGGRISVRTKKSEHESSDWTSEALAKRRWGVHGYIIGMHDSHGTYYDVQHSDDATIAPYEPHELELF